MSLNKFQQDYRDGNNNDDTLLNMNLVPVYEELKITGKGIRVAIIDDGLEYTHDDLKNNYVSIVFTVFFLKRSSLTFVVYHGLIKIFVFTFKNVNTLVT